MTRASSGSAAGHERQQRADAQGDRGGGAHDRETRDEETETDEGEQHAGQGARLEWDRQERED